MTLRLRIAAAVNGGMSPARAVVAAMDAATGWRIDAIADGHVGQLVHSLKLAKRIGTVRARRRVGKQNVPKHIESDYASRLVSIVTRARAHYAKFKTEMMSTLTAMQPRAIEAPRGDAGDDPAFSQRLLDSAEAQMRQDMSATQIDQLAQFFARQTSQAQRAELSRQLSSALGITVEPDERYIPAMLDYFTHENAQRIISIGPELHAQIAALTRRAFSKKMLPETFANLLEERFGVAESKARFLANDQIGKLWGQLNAVRQRGLGINNYFWRTRGDSLVRPSHRKLANKRMSYDDPPDFGLPGEDFNCRCQAEPDVSGIIANAASALIDHAVPVGIGRRR